MERVELSEQQWAAMRAASGLPERARTELDDVLTLYRGLRQSLAAQPSASETRRELIHIANLAEKLSAAIIGENADARAALCGELDGLAVDKILSSIKTPVRKALMTAARHRVADDEEASALAVSQGIGMPRGDALRLLCEWLLSVERLQSWFKHTADSLPAEIVGAHKAAEQHLWLVGQLDAILFEATGKHVGRSNKRDSSQRYVEMCFSAADPPVGTGSIKKAIETYVGLNPKRQRARAKTAKKTACS
jgi:hypothetical protein